MAGSRCGNGAVGVKAFDVDPDRGAGDN